MLRRSIDKLQHAEFNLFAFNSESRTLSYTISSAPADDHDTMDASTLMSPDYVQPLIPSDLALLIQQVFDPDNISCLKHLAAKKLVHAQGSRIFSISNLFPRSMSDHPNDQRSTSPTSPVSPPITSQTMVPYSSGVSPYFQARITDHTQQQEKLAQIRLAKWAGDLQRSLQNERTRYEAIARGERAVWLTERLGETVKDGALVCTQHPTTGNPSEKGTGRGVPDPSGVTSHRGLLDASDPLGLLRWNEAMKRRGWIAFQVVGSFGILGAMAVWMARTWGGGSDGYGTSTWGWFGERP